MSRTRGLEKRGRIERVKKRKERGKGREVNKVSWSLPYQGTLAICLCQEETRDRRASVAATGSCALAGEQTLSTPGGQDVSCSKESPHQSCCLLKEGGTVPGSKSGLLSNTRK